MPTITQLQYILAVDAEKNFVKAAESCYVTQPTLSMQIQKLEEELGVQIFDRSRVPVKTTDIGKKILSQAKVIVNESRKIQEIINYENKELNGTFRLGIIPTIAPSLIAIFIEDFIRDYPKVQLNIEEIQTESLLNALKHDKLDAGILATDISQESDLSKIDLYSEPFVAYISKNHRLQDSTKINYSNLILDDIWLLKEGHCFRDQVLQICQNYNKSNKINIKFEAGSLDTLIHIVDSGLGMTLLPELTIKDMNELELEKVKYFEKPYPSRQVSIAFHKSFLKKNIILTIEKLIKSNLNKLKNLNIEF